MLVEFSLKPAYSTICGNIFQIYGVHIPRKSIESRYFHKGISCLLPPHSKLSPSTYHHTLSRWNLFIHPGSILFKNLFSPTAERGGGNYDLLYQNSMKKLKMTWNIRLFTFFMICYFYSVVNNIYHVVWY